MHRMILPRNFRAFTGSKKWSTPSVFIYPLQRMVDTVRFLFFPCLLLHLCSWYGHETRIHTLRDTSFVRLLLLTNSGCRCTSACACCLCCKLRACTYALFQSAILTCFSFLSCLQCQVHTIGRNSKLILQIHGEPFGDDMKAVVPNLSSGAKSFEEAKALKSGTAGFVGAMNEIMHFNAMLVVLLSQHHGEHVLESSISRPVRNSNEPELGMRS